MAPPRSSGSTDPGWEHGISQDEKKKKVKCNYCGKVVSGGIYRLKQHLARISGEVTFCRKAPEEVCIKMKENLVGSQAIKKHRRYEDDDRASFDLPSNDDNEETDEPGDSKVKEGESDKCSIICATPLRSPGYVDPGWEHGVAQDARKKKVKCNYCEKIVSGGINRFKQHLARIPGEVSSCKMAPDEVYLKMKENMKWHRTGRRQQSESELNSFLDNSDHDEAGEELANGGTEVGHLLGDQLLVPHKGRKKRLSNCSDPETNHLKSQRQLTVSESKKNCDDDVILAISKFFYHSAVPLGAANSPYFHQMLDLISQRGPEWKCPSLHLLSGPLLQEKRAMIKGQQLETRATWMVTGCTILAERSTDLDDPNGLKFFVSCPRGTSFISAVSGSDIAEDPHGVFKFLDKIVEEVGAENVVQVVTENSPLFRAAGKLLEEKMKNLFWMPCAAYSMDLVLEDFLKINYVNEGVVKAQKITQLIYNHSWLLNLAKDFTSGDELVSPATTRSASTFVTLGRLLDCRSALKRLFQSSNWISSRFSHDCEGQRVQNLVLDLSFWKAIQSIAKAVDPVLQMLLKLDRDGGIPLHRVFYDLHQAKLAIKETHDGEAVPFIAAFDSHLGSLLHHPLSAAAYFFNPSFRYRPNFLLLPEIVCAVNECITHMEPDSGRRVSASMQVQKQDRRFCLCQG
ncbi:hAT dimerization domain-containing protein isoform X2 [Wolffia australiana]